MAESGRAATVAAGQEPTRAEDENDVEKLQLAAQSQTAAVSLCPVEDGGRMRPASWGHRKPL